MANLILLRKEKVTKNLNEETLHPEERVQNLIYENRAIFPDIVMLKTQLTSYSKSERIDIIGLDNESNIVVIEIKDETVDETVIPQVMRYALWVETNPDAIKSIWLEQRDLHEDFDFDWNKGSGIRIMVVGPSFIPAVPRLVNRLLYPTELIEFKKFSNGDTEYIFLNKLEVEDIGMLKPVDTTREYDLEYHEENRNSKSAVQFWALANRVEEYVREKEWNLDRSNTKNYVSFKSGFPIVFGVGWIGTKSFALFFKIPKKVAEEVEIPGYSLHNYQDSWGRALYRVETSDVDLDLFNPLFDAAFKHIVGE